MSVRCMAAADFQQAMKRPKKLAMKKRSKVKRKRTRNHGMWGYK